MQHNTAAVSNNNDFVVVLGDMTSMKKFRCSGMKMCRSTLYFSAHTEKN